LSAVPEYHTRTGRILPLWNKPVSDHYTYEQARTFCAWNGTRLPTEAEWEKAAAWNTATSTKSIWPWGNVFDPVRLNSTESNRGDTVQVAQFPAEQNSTFDMAGNVAEWTNSLYLPYPYNADDGREEFPASGDRVVRGGSWSESMDATTTTTHQAVDPALSTHTLGFRCAVSP
jgi:formylglycine-generating enzyme required for sulfatase activity